LTTRPALSLLLFSTLALAAVSVPLAAQRQNPTIDDRSAIQAEQMVTLAEPPGLDFYTVTPCRVVDTRTTDSPLTPGVITVFVITGVCGIPSDAAVISINVTVAAPTAGGHVTVFPAFSSPPAVSTLNFTVGTTRANNAVVALSPGSAVLGALVVLTSRREHAHLIVDVNGYFK